MKVLCASVHRHRHRTESETPKDLITCCHFGNSLASSLLFQWANEQTWKKTRHLNWFSRYINSIALNTVLFGCCSSRNFNKFILWPVNISTDMKLLQLLVHQCNISNNNAADQNSIRIQLSNGWPCFFFWFRTLSH